MDWIKATINNIVKVWPFLKFKYKFALIKRRYNYGLDTFYKNNTLYYPSR